MLLTMAIIVFCIVVALVGATVLAACILGGWVDDKQATLNADADELLPE